MAPKKTAKAALDELEAGHQTRQATWREKAKAKAEEIARKNKGKLPPAWDVSGSLSGGAKCLRILLVLCNVALLIFALWLLVRASYNKMVHVYALLETWFTPAIVLGVFFLSLSFLGALGAWFMNRIVLWIYAILLALFGFVMMVASSYMLAKLNDGRTFLTQAWVNSPQGIQDNLEQTFTCCGLNTFMDEYAFLPCPDGSYENLTMPNLLRNATKSAANLTGYGCMDAMLEQFDQYSTSIPTAGLVMWVGVTAVAVLAAKMALMISKALRENSVEMV